MVRNGVLLVAGVAGTLALGLTSGVATAGDAEAGKKVFAKCAVCHVVDKPQNKVGPTLHGVIGRPAGTVEGFKYSDAMKNSGLVWDEATLDAYLENPKEHVKGTKMAFAGLKKPEDRANVIAYIAEASKN